MGFDVVTFLAQIVNLFVLIWILKRFLYRPVLQIIDQRRQMIASTVKEAEEKLASAKQTEADLQKQKQTFETSYQQQLMQMDADIAQQKKLMTDQLMADVEDKKLHLQEALNRSFDNAEQAIQTMIAEEFMALTQKVLSEWTEQTSVDQMILLFEKKILSLSKKQRNHLQELFESLHTIQFISGEKLNKAQKEAVRHVLASQFEINPKLNLQFKVNSAVLLGFEMRMGDFILEWTLNAYLQEINERLKTNISGMIVPKQGKAEK